ncbi:MAG TPA: potassium channel family protein [Geminicoccaceae bacterium]
MAPLLLIFRRRHWQHYRYQLRQVDMRQTLIRTALWLVVVFAVHSWAMVAFEGMALGDSIWLTLTTVLTVGYGDYAAATLPGRIATVMLIYVGGVFVLFNLAGDYFEYRTESRLAMAKGRWRWNMEDHVLVLNSPTVNSERYITGLVRELRRGHHWCNCPVQLLCRDYPDGLPDAFKELGIVHYDGDPSDPDDLEAVAADKASIIIILAEHVASKRSDEITYDILARLRELKARGRIVAECVHHKNRERLRRSGAEIVIRPIRFYPEIVVRAIESPGSEVILENLFTIKGDECLGFEVNVGGLTWQQVVVHLLAQKLGTAIAYRHRITGEVRMNPEPDEEVDALMVYMIVKAHRRIKSEDVRAALDRIKATVPEPA